VDDTPPFYFGRRRLISNAKVQSGALLIVDALRQVLIGKMLHAFDLHRQAIFDYQVRRIRADVLALVRQPEKALAPSPEDHVGQVPR
jgi:hypothetical protein